ncbi:Uncharacterised protein [Escherichia coli]|uniref:DUF4326 domain-containing protein n=1 Tax=Escherichia coli TaxID=562 RepID=UPI0013F8FE96|nr:DUF4326 domain-containing protein [Escherichia coli]NES47965.1 DUF4326 domain-containing protein [Escherichia coli]VVZ28863.1 Uncharacterised protein [Escherichia coli]VVZ36232.1 Uncharacterised protein [Escherichia coli]VWN21568.1 Uncharacterised protein [Escherichia coli]
MDLKPIVVNKYKEPYDVYIGRGSKWGNPFTHIKDKQTKAEFIVSTREESIEKFRDYIIERISCGEVKIDELLELAGKRLGCFCKPKSCHGDVLVEIVSAILDELPDDNQG